MKNFFLEKDVTNDDVKKTIEELIEKNYELQQGLLALSLVELKEYANNSELLIDKIQNIEDNEEYNNLVDIFNTDMNVISNTILNNLKNYDMTVYGKKIIHYTYDELNLENEKRMNEIIEIYSKLENNFSIQERDLNRLIMTDELETLSEIKAQYNFNSKFNSLKFSDYPSKLSYQFVQNIMDNKLFPYFQEWFENHQDEYLQNKIKKCYLNAVETLKNDETLKSLNEQEKSSLHENIYNRIFIKQNFINTCNEIINSTYTQRQEFQIDFLNDFGVIIQKVLIDEIKNAIIESDEKYILDLKERGLNEEHIFVDILNKFKEKQYGNE